ncbi:MAG: ribosome assembly cofactor RimP [Sphingobacteriales bacterium]|jgi:ribosome maturation factor RimP|nr:ribosome assembly cofactor RimP [Sphingobacteriales bacterium]MBP9140418.1 hypothetical protein [Chitinophagales bacterium]MDA0197317.1 ribosome assembly cofactor RimP [Bacteroidota bacterium]MBK6890106.1 ribosome assembly cofactor RimP [Sphingobacteriales bacterium]MBK7527367.1 ribosome assembly cofactor RimP [Sphingobacteriales bacterium]
MIPEQVTQLITDHLATYFAETNCFLVEIRTGGKKIEVYADCDENMDLNKCTAISRYLEPFLDAADFVPEDYVLEVSSPGMGNPFKVVRQYTKNIGREVQVTLISGEKIEGILQFVAAENIVLAVPEKKISLKKAIDKNPKTTNHEISFSDILQTKKKITFN